MAKITALAAPRLQKVMAEQADPFGVSVGSLLGLCHHQVRLDANTLNGNFVCSTLCGREALQICLYLCVWFLIILMQSSS